jgi:Uma2 family endonuclease
VHPTFIDGPADLVVEVVSPESRTHDRVEKFREYQLAGVRDYWLIDPAAKTAEAYRLSVDGSYERVADASGRLTCIALPGFWMDAAWLWAEAPDEWAAYEAWGLI